MNSDYKIYKKARRRVITRLIFDCLLVFAMAAGTEIILSLDFLGLETSYVSQMVTMVTLSECLAWMLLFLGLAFGKGWVRWLYWPLFAVQAAAFYLPLKLLMADYDHTLLYLAWMFCLFMMLVVLMQMGLWFFRNKWARIYYDHVLLVPDNAPEPVSQPVVQQPAVQVQQPMFQQPVQQVIKTVYVQKPEPQPEPVRPKPVPPMTWPQVALRLGITVYGELVCFPMFVQFFQGWFASYDMQKVFATRDMFLICIFSAFIWTVPLFFLYYSQKGARKAIWGAIGVEVLFAIWNTGRLISYWDLKEYSFLVFALFIMLDVIRYLLILHAVWPVLTDKAVPGEQEEINLDDIEL